MRTFLIVFLAIFSLGFTAIAQQEKKDSLQSANRSKMVMTPSSSAGADSIEIQDFHIWISVIDVDKNERMTYDIKNKLMFIKMGSYHSLSNVSTRDHLMYSIYFSKEQKREMNALFEELYQTDFEHMYWNPCVEKGTGQVVLITLTANEGKENIVLQNYYLEEVEMAINHINKVVPDSYKIKYDAQGLLKAQQSCDKLIKN